MAMIKSGNLKAGTGCPPSADGHRLRHQPAAVREALKALTVMGVLESRQGGRYTVTDLSPSRLIAPFNVMLSVGRLRRNEHFEARAVVDIALVRLCTVRASRRAPAHPRAGRRWSCLPQDPVAFRLLDIEFHQAMNDGADNRLLSALAQGLYDVGWTYWRLASAVPASSPRASRQHCEVAEAMVAARRRCGVAAYQRHLEHVRDTT